MPNDALVKFIKQQYPPGTRIRLDAMNDPYNPIAPGTLGKVEFVDDIGQIHMKWDNGSGLAIIPGEDRFSVVKPELKPMKLYMPLTGERYARDRWRSLEEYPEELDGGDLLEYKDAFVALLSKFSFPEERERGLMRWYHENDSVGAKVHYMEFTAEEHYGKLWGVVICDITDDLTPKELDTLKQYALGQASDGLGESAEQRELKGLDGSETYIHLWSDSKNWSLMTEAEFEAAHDQEYGGMQYGHQI
jgi:hypothetical protein